MSIKTKSEYETLLLLYQWNIAAMQAAWIEWVHGGGAQAAMGWIENTLEGPGLIPDEDELNGKCAQAWFDANKGALLG